MKRHLGILSVSLLSAVCVLVVGCGQSPAPKDKEQSSAPPAGACPTLSVVKTIVGGGEGRWDFVTVDSQAQRVYVARESRIMVFDAAKGNLAGEIADVPGAHGVVVVGELNLGFATAGRDNTIRVFDLKTLATIRTIKAGVGPDAILYDPSSKKVLVFNHRGGDITIVDPASLDKAPSTLAVGGTLEVGVADGTGHVYVNVEDKSEVVAIDTKAMKVLAHWPLAPGQEPSGLAIDTAHRRLFAGCGNKKMIVLDADSGKVLSEVAIGDGVDGAAFDPQTGVAMSSNGKDGTVTAVREGPAGQFKAIQTVSTAKGARTIAADTKTHRFYLPASMPAGNQAASKFGLIVVGDSKDIAK